MQELPNHLESRISTFSQKKSISISSTSSPERTRTSTRRILKSSLQVWVQRQSTHCLPAWTLTNSRTNYVTRQKKRHHSSVKLRHSNALALLRLSGNQRNSTDRNGWSWRLSLSSLPICVLSFHWMADDLQPLTSMTSIEESLSGTTASKDS